MSTGQIEQDSGVEADWMAQGKCWDMDPAIFFPSDGIGVEAAATHLRGVPRQGPVFGVRAGQQDCSWRLGGCVRTRASAHPSPAENVATATDPRLNLAVDSGPSRAQ